MHGRAGGAVGRASLGRVGPCLPGLSGGAEGWSSDRICGKCECTGASRPAHQSASDVRADGAAGLRHAFTDKDKLTRGSCRPAKTVTSGRVPGGLNQNFVSILSRDELRQLIRFRFPVTSALFLSVLFFFVPFSSEDLCGLWTNPSVGHQPSRPFSLPITIGAL